MIMNNEIHVFIFIIFPIINAVIKTKLNVCSCHATDQFCGTKDAFNKDVNSNVS